MKKKLTPLIVLGLLSLWVYPVFADELQDAWDQYYYFDNQVNSLSKQKQTEEKNLNTKKSDQQYIDSLKSKSSTELQQIKGEIGKINEDLSAIDSSIKESEEKYEAQKELLKGRLKAMYQNSANTYLEAVIESKSLSDFLQRVQLMKLMTKRDKQIEEALETAKKDVETKKQLKLQEQQAVQAKADDKQRQLNSLEAQRTSIANDIARISSTLKQLDNQIDQFNNLASEMKGTINSLMSKGSNYAGGSMTWPTPGYTSISSYYGYRMHPILKEYKYHSGVDIGAPYGATIVAANKGKVIVSGWQDGYGNTIIIDHGGGIATLYGHASRLLVGVGTTVDAGTPIAIVGSTGMATGPHLHFEVRKDGATDDPFNYVSP